MVYPYYSDPCYDLIQKLDLTQLKEEVEQPYQFFAKLTPKQEVIILIRTTADTKSLLEKTSGKLG